MRKITVLKETGFCNGVARAIKMAMDASRDKSLKRPIYLLGSIVHNNHVNSYLESLGLIILNEASRLEMIKKIDKGTVIFSAHGVSKEVRDIAIEKGLDIVDATCPYVNKSVLKMKEKLDDGYDLIFIGSKNHPETEVAKSLSNKVYLLDEINFLNSNKIFLSYQTTMSKYDIEQTLIMLNESFCNIEVVDALCKVTEHRQKAIHNLINYPHLNPCMVIIIGDKDSNNSKKLYEISSRIKSFDTLFIDNIYDLNLPKLKKYNEFIIASGTSTPIAICEEVRLILEDLDNISDERITSNIEMIDYILRKKIG